MKHVFAVGVFLAVFAFNMSFAADFIFINKTNVHVDYQLAHHDLETKTTGSAAAGEDGRHTDLTGFGDRAILVWSKDGKLLYAGKGGSMKEGFNLTLTFQTNPKNLNDFIIIPALSK